MERQDRSQQIKLLPRRIKNICSLIAFLYCLLPTISFGYDITLTWETNADPVNGYKLFLRIDNQEYDYEAAVYQGSENTCTITGLSYDVQYYFVARSFVEDGAVTIDSEDSNEVHYLRNAPDPEPAPASDPDPAPASDPDPSVQPESQPESGLEQQTVEPQPETKTTTESQTVLEPENRTVVIESQPVVRLIRGISFYTPEAIAPADGSIEVALAPTFQAAKYSENNDSDGVTHVKTEWQISRDADFSDIVLKMYSRTALTEMTMPQLILKENTTYYWRVRYFDADGGVSDYSQAAAFTTGGTIIEDADQNGVPDDLEVDSQVDLDGNGVPDIHQETIKTMNMISSDYQVGVALAPEAGRVDMVQAIDTDLVNDHQNQPQQMLMDLVGFRLQVEKGATVEVVIYFSKKLPQNVRWFKHDILNGWQDFSDHTVFSDTGDGRTRVTFSLQDGGFGDEDGIANGVIIDPSGPGLASLADTAIETADPVISAAGSGEGGSGGCFIGSAEDRDATPFIPVTTILVVMISLIGVMCQARK